MRGLEKRIYFRAFEYSDLEFVNQLRNDDGLFKLTCGNKYYTSTERDKEWISDKITNNYNQLYLMLCKTDDARPIGYISAANIDYVNRKAEWSGIVIAKEFAGNGYGVEASQLLLKHLFCELGMNMVYCFVREDHTASLKMIEKTGYRKEGTIRDFVYKSGKFHSVCIQSILRSEYDDLDLAGTD